MERSKKRSLAQTPAPAKDKIYGSKVNKKGSASSESNAESIKLSDAIVSVLEGKMEEHNAEYPNRKVTLAVLKAVFRRGAGAYSRSHRPTISGGKPNSRTAWAYARVNKFLEKKAGKPVKKAYVQDDDLIGKYAKGGLIAPNGKKSNLTPEQYKLVRTKAFKDWFGDWESKRFQQKHIGYSDIYPFDTIALDENGEPRVWHRGANHDYNKFENEYIYLGSKKSYVKQYGKPKEFFIKPEKTIFIDNEQIEKLGLGVDFKYLVGYISEENDIPRKGKNYRELKKLFSNQKDALAVWQYFTLLGNKEELDLFRNWFKEFGFDSIMYWETGLKNNFGKYPTGLISLYFGNEIKLADGSNTTFDGSNPDIRYAKGGLIAPNGKQSNLNAEQYKLVRTKAFKDWFGDWENDPENASKVVDENGEPLVVYHGSYFGGNVFKVKYNNDGIGLIYFSDKKAVAEKYGNSREFFLKIENLDEIDVEGRGFNDAYDNTSLESELRYVEDGIVVRNIFDDPSGKKKGKISNVYAVKYPEQIKLADGTNTTFDGSNPDIRFEDGGKIQNMIDNGTIELKMYDTKPEHAEIYGLKSKRPLYFQRVFVDEKQRLNGLGTKILKYLDEYAKSNNHDLIFGHIAENSEPNVKVIKAMLEKAGYTTIEGNNDFYKYVDSDNYQLPDSTKFMRWWIEWYKPIVDKFNIYISFPIDSTQFAENNVVILELFEKKDQDIDAKPYLNEIVKKADEYGTTIYLTPTPRYKYFPKDSEKGRKVTKSYLTEYYKRFGFELTDGDFMKRLPKKKFHLGGDMSKHLAPNGKPSNLNHEQWHLVRTPEFKAWFGDWENDPENASKVVDENGEPLVVYRGTTESTKNVSGLWLSKSKSYAESFGDVMQYFVKIIEPMPEELFNKTWMVDFNLFDGRLGDFHKIVVKKPEQIKLADGSNTTFDGSNPDIRYAKGGAIKQGKGDCYQTSGNIAIDGGIKGVKFVGKPYLVQAEVQGQGSIRGLRYGHSWIEDDELVYDYSNGRSLQIPKIIYYLLGDIKTVKPKYYRYTFAQAKKKMLETGHYGSWELETESGL